MTDINDAYVNAILSDASYALSDGIEGYTNQDLEDFLATRMTPSLAAYIGDNFTVVTSIDTDDFTDSGFDAVIFKRNSDNKIFISMRGTEGPGDFVTDIELTTGGVAMNQVVDMINWWMRVTTPIDEMTVQVDRDLLFGSNTYVSGEGVPELVGVTSVEVNGHSLGGHLAAAFARVFNGRSVSVENITTFNSAGFTVTSNPIFSLIDELLSPGGGDGAFFNNQLNMYSENGFSLTTRDWLNIHHGDRVSLENEESDNPINNHFMYKITDALALGDLLSSIDMSLDLSKLNEILAASSNNTESSLEKLLDNVGKIFGVFVAETPVGDVGDSAASRVAYYNNLFALRSVIGNDAGPSPYTNAFTIATVLDASSARSDFGVFLSLVNLTPFVLHPIDADGETLLKNEHSSLADDWYTDQSLPDNDRTYTDQYLTTRAQFLNLIIHRNTQDIPSDESTNPALPDAIFIDQSGEILTTGSVTPLNYSNNGTARRYLFGNNSVSVFGGSSSNDYLFGMGGNDTLSGAAGDDYLEGGTHNDTLTGGVGNDDLHGGTGTDTYLFSSGDGLDHIIDETHDATDQIQIDGFNLSTYTFKSAPTNSGDPGLYIGEHANDNAPSVSLFYNGVSLTISINGGVVNGGNTIEVNHFTGSGFGFDLGSVDPVAMDAPDGYTVVGDLYMVNLLVGAVSSAYLQNNYVARMMVGQDNSQPFFYNADSVTFLPTSSDYQAAPYVQDPVTTFEFVEFQGGDGNDYLIGGSRNDILSGNGGDDFINVGGGGVDERNLADGGQGSDTILGGDGKDWLWGFHSPQWLEEDGSRIVPFAYDALLGEFTEVAIKELLEDSDTLLGAAGDDVLVGVAITM